jgi:hypothetical protein
MCLLSNKIKFCTCAISDTEKLKHYWILYRLDKNKNIICVGQPIFPILSMIDINCKVNKTVLLDRINEVDAFDVPLSLQNKDILEIVINNNNAMGIDSFTYTFKFVKDKWKAVENDVFKIMNDYEEEQSGKIKSALKRKI